MKVLVLVFTFTVFISFSQEIDSLNITKDVVLAMRQVKVKHLNISLVSLIATPERFDGEMVQVKGFLHLELESSAIYIHEDDYKNKLTANGFWVNFSEKLDKKKNSLDYNDRYVIIIGKFDAGEKGNKGLYSGSIKNIIRLD